MPPVFGKRLERRAEAPTLLGTSAGLPGERWSAEWLTFRAMTVLNIKINCIALTSAQARLTMMFAMRHPNNRALHEAAWLAFERAKAHDDLALRLASLRVVDALLHQLPPDRGDLAPCGLEAEWQAPNNTARCS